MMKTIDGFLPEQQRDLRHSQARKLKEALSEPLRPIASIVDPIHDNIHHSDGYGQLAEELFSALTVRMSDSVPSGATLHGFRILTRILSYAPEAYKAYRPAKERSVEELHEIALRSGDVATRIANMDNARNYHYELHLGLSRGTQYSSSPLVINTPDGVPVFDYERSAYTTAVFSAPRGIGQEEPAPYRKCPALGFVLASVWESAVNECAERPELFPAALVQEVSVVD